VRFFVLLLALCACGARTDLGGTKASSSDAGSSETSTGCHDEIIATDPNGAGPLVVDGDVVFWGTPLGVLQMHDASGNKTLASPGDAIASIAVDATYVYYATTGFIRRVPRAGGPSEDLFTKAGLPFDIVLVGADVFWLDYGQGIAAGSVRRNGTPILSMLDTPGGLAIDGGHVFVDCALALVNQQGVLGPLLRANLDGSDLQTLVTDLHQAGSVKAYGGRVYYIEQVDGTSTLHGGVRSIDENGGAPKIELTTDDWFPIDFAADSSGVYVTALTQPTTSELVRGSVQIAQTTGVVYEGVRTTADAVYWAIGWTSSSPPPTDGASVRKICK